MMELEGRALLSTFTGNNTVHHGDLDRLRPAAGTPAVNHVVLRANSARVDGGLPNDGSTTRRDVAIRNNTVYMGSGLSGARDVTHARSVHSRRAFTAPILSDDFNGTGGVPKNWTQILGAPGDVVEKVHNLTITDSTGKQAGIASNPSKSVPFDPQGVTTTITAVINSTSVKPVGNAIFGLLGPNGTAQPGTLAAGIDSQGNVFIIEYDPAQNIQQPRIVSVGQDTGYKGGLVTMTLKITSKDVQVTEGSINRKFSFGSGDFNKFSLKTAFPNDAVPALVAASQPKQEGGAASFQSISVSTASGGVRLTGRRADRGGRLALG
jgi:hypothetical protein